MVPFGRRIEGDLSPRLAAYRQRHTERKSPPEPGLRARRPLRICHRTGPEPVDIYGDGDPVALSDVPVNSMPPALERYARTSRSAWACQ